MILDRQTIRRFLARVLLVTVVCACVQTIAYADEPFAVVELFTSQGCSSCPPADQLLGELSAPEERIFALSFHVDYWNRLGWVDPFSDSDFSKRQRRYAQVLKDRRVYTPEMVINGQDGFIGSDRLRAQHRISQALKDSARVDLAMTFEVGPNDDRLKVHYQLDSVPDETVFHVALVERMAKVDVPHGENAGRTLQHHHVVREFVTVPADAQGTVRIKIPDGLQLGDFEIIGFLQHKKTMHILAADLATAKKG